MGKFNAADMRSDRLVPINGCDEGEVATKPSVVAAVAELSLLLGDPLKKF